MRGNKACVNLQVPKKLVRIVIYTCASKGLCSTDPYSVGSLKYMAALLIKNVDLASLEVGVGFHIVTQASGGVGLGQIILSTVQLLAAICLQFLHVLLPAFQRSVHHDRGPDGRVFGQEATYFLAPSLVGSCH
jgi:hypothetical protein